MDGWMPIVGGKLNGGWYYPPDDPKPHRPVFVESDEDGIPLPTVYRISLSCKRVIPGPLTPFRGPDGTPRRPERPISPDLPDDPDEPAV